MENAVKALLIASGVLIGVLILSLGSILYSSLSSYTEEVHESIERNELDKFNVQFTAYIREADEEEYLTIQDIVTVANIAFENNQKHNVNVDSAGENSYYVQVLLGEKNIEDGQAEELLEGNFNKYICPASNITFSRITGRVISIKFEEKK